MCSGKMHVDNFCLVEEGPCKKSYKIVNGIHGIRSFYLSCSITVQKKKKRTKPRNGNTQLLKMSPFQHKVPLVSKSDYHKVMVKRSELKFYILKIKKRVMERNWIP